MNLVALLVPITLFAMIFGIVYVAISSSHRQKIAMIEAGMNPNEEEDKDSPWMSGYLFVFVPLGIILGNVLAHYTSFLDAGVLGLLGAFLFGGLGMLLARRQNEKNKQGGGK
jgi:UDP-N-acetylmuramyl pentapeptide phosphotransferase/UDP-N-acetylglucosamine-1-phosphate transferase